MTILNHLERLLLPHETNKANKIRRKRRWMQFFSESEKSDRNQTNLFKAGDRTLCELCFAAIELWQSVS